MDQMQEKIEQAANHIINKIEVTPTIGMILGSGLGPLAEEIENKTVISYQDIPYFPRSTVEGHKGQMVFGKLRDQTVVAMQGRFHYYEGYSLQDVVFPVRVMKELGVNILIVTNAAGAVNESYEPGDLMIITDHINLLGDNPLMGANLDKFGSRFPDMSEAYDRELRQLALSTARSLGVKVQQGVYTSMTGPSYETPAEIRMVRILGGDAVGMSTVPEVITAVHSGIRVLGISCMTNMAAGILEQPLSHEEVIETSKKVKDQFILLVKSIISNIKNK